MTDKSAIVTGGGSGIGKGVAKAFAAKGYSVVIADVDEKAASKVAEEICQNQGRAKAIKVDVSVGEDVLALMNATMDFAGRIDAIIGAAGLWRGGTVLTMSEEDWTRVMAVNATGLFWIARYSHPHLKASHGSITTISSIAGLKGTRSAGAYNASKAAVIALTKNIALDFASDGIRANCICPGLVDTPMANEVLEFRGGGQKLYDDIVKLHPIGRLGTPQDIAGSALFLASKDAAWITGTSLVVDGGCMAGY